LDSFFRRRIQSPCQDSNPQGWGASGLKIITLTTLPQTPLLCYTVYNLTLSNNFIQKLTWVKSIYISSKWFNLQGFTLSTDWQYRSSVKMLWKSIVLSACILKYHPWALAKSVFSFRYLLPQINKNCRRTATLDYSKKLSQECFIEYNNAYLYEYIKFPKKVQRLVIKMLLSKSLLYHYGCIKLSQKKAQTLQ
jgi:hypothetical protein